MVFLVAVSLSAISYACVQAKLRNVLFSFLCDVVNSLPSSFHMKTKMYHNVFCVVVLCCVLLCACVCVLVCVCVCVC